MSNVIIYTDLDSLWDTRRATLESLMPQDAKWDDYYAKLYNTRRMDFFERKELGITQDHYLDAFAKRNLKLFERGVLPTGLITRILKLVLDVDQLVGKPISLGMFRFTVNMFPYVLDKELQAVLLETLNSSVAYDAEFTLVYVPTEKLLPNYFRPYTHVFKYDLLGRDSKAFFDDLKNNPIPTTKFFVPSLIQKMPDDNKLLAEPEEIIQKMNLFIGTAITLIPTNIAVYDYRQE